MYAGCVSGAIDKNEYLQIIEKSGFAAITIQKNKVIQIPSDILARYLGDADLEKYNRGEYGIFSITVYAEKPVKSSSCCAPGCCG